MDQQQLLSARIMQRTNLIIMPMVFVSYVLGKGFRTLLGLTLSYLHQCHVVE